MQGPIRVFVSVWVSVVCVLGIVPCALGDAFLEQANRAASVTPGTKALEDVLFPALAAMDEPPSLDLSVEDMVILRETDSRWRELERWAMRDPQQAVIKALAEVGDPNQRFVLGIAYDSARRAPEDWRRAGLVNSIGRGSELGTVSFDYLDRMEWLLRLALVDSFRLAREGNGEASLDVLIDLLRLGRVLADRPSATEKQFAFVLMRVALERVRDVVYSHRDAFTSTILKDAIPELDDRAMTLNRIPFPVFERLAAEQALARGFEERGEVRAGDLAELMAKSAANLQPLRTFSEFAWYERLASQHEGWFETKDRIQAVWGDFEIRWNNQNWNEPTLRRVTEFEQTDPTRFSVIRRFGGIDAETDLYRFLSQIRFDTVTELRGTYNALGVVAFRIDNRAFPPVLAAIQPRYVPRLALDPYAWNERLRRQEDFGFFVPIRDQTFGPRELPRPYAIRVNLFEDDGTQAPVAVPDDAPAGPGMSMMGGTGDAATDDGGNRRTLDRRIQQWSTLVFNMTPLIAGAAEPEQMQAMLDLMNGIVTAEGMAPIPADVLDLDRRTIRATPLRNWAVQAIQNAPLDTFDLREGDGLPEELVSWLRGKELTPESMRREVVEAIERELPRQTKSALSAMGVNLDDFRSLIGDIVAEMMQRTEVTGFVEKIQNNRQYTAEDARKFAGAAVDAMLQDKFVERFRTLSQVLVRGMQDESVIGLLEGAGGGSFIAMVDDSQFLLYSLGPNRSNDLAAVVGAGGDDILIWPPISALRRENQ